MGFNQPAAESCSQTFLLEFLRSPPESGSRRSRTGATPLRPAAPCLPCSGVPGSGSPQVPCSVRGCVVGGHVGGAVPSSPYLADWDPFSPQPQWGKLGGFQESDWKTKEAQIPN